MEWKEAGRVGKVQRCCSSLFSCCQACDGAAGQFVGGLCGWGANSLVESLRSLACLP